MERINGSREREGNRREENKEGEKEGGREEERERGRKGGKERRARRDGGSKVFTFLFPEYQYTHMYGEYDAPKRMYVYQMKECLFLLCTFHMKSEKLTFMYFLHHNP